MTGFILLLAFEVEAPNQNCTYFGITPYSEGSILQLVNGKVRQHIGKISCNIRSGSERNRV